MLTAAEVYDKRSVEMLVIDEGCMVSRATLVLQREVTVLVASKHVAFLLI